MKHLLKELLDTDIYWLNKMWEPRGIVLKKECFSLHIEAKREYELGINIIVADLYRNDKQNDPDDYIELTQMDCAYIYSRYEKDLQPMNPYRTEGTFVMTTFIKEGEDD